MARSDKPGTGTQAELTASSGSTTGADETERKAADLAALEARLAREKRALEEREASLRQQEQALNSRAQSVEERASEVRRGAAELDQRWSESRLSAAGSTLPTSEAPTMESDEVLVLNNSNRIIGAADGTALVPTQLTTLKRTTWLRWFDSRGKPVPGVAGHFSTEGKARPDLQEVTLANLSALPEEHAVKVVQSSEDVGLLEKFQDTESREGVKAAVKQRLAALRKR